MKIGPLRIISESVDFALQLADIVHKIDIFSEPNCPEATLFFISPSFLQEIMSRKIIVLSIGYMNNVNVQLEDMESMLEVNCTFEIHMF